LINTTIKDQVKIWSFMVVSITIKGEKMLTIQQNELGPRLYVFRRRIHHGLVGALGLAIGVSLKNKVVCLPFALMLWHDRMDFPFRDSNNH
jgi:hypothetical protein